MFSENFDTWKDEHCLIIKGPRKGYGIWPRAEAFSFIVSRSYRLAFLAPRLHINREMEVVPICITDEYITFYYNYKAGAGNHRFLTRRVGQ
jgi:hypothetical protein